MTAHRLAYPPTKALPASLRGSRPAPSRVVPGGMSITRLDRTARHDALVLYRISVDGDDHLLYPDEIHSQFGIPADALPAACENA